jgi:hypothetical protein
VGRPVVNSSGRTPSHLDGAVPYLLPMRRQGVLRDREELHGGARHSALPPRFSEALIGLRVRCEGRDFFTFHVCGRGFESRRRRHPFGTDVVAQSGRAHRAQPPGPRVRSPIILITQVRGSVAKSGVTSFSTPLNGDPGNQPGWNPSRPVL